MREQSRRKRTAKHWPSFPVGGTHWLTFELSQPPSERSPVGRLRGGTVARRLVAAAGRGGGRRTRHSGREQLT